MNNNDSAHRRRSGLLRESQVIDAQSYYGLLSTELLSCIERRALSVKCKRVTENCTVYGCLRKLVLQKYEIFFNIFRILRKF